MVTGGIPLPPPIPSPSSLSPSTSNNNLSSLVKSASLQDLANTNSITSGKIQTLEHKISQLEDVQAQNAELLQKILKHLEMKK